LVDYQALYEALASDHPARCARNRDLSRVEAGPAGLAALLQIARMVTA